MSATSSRQARSARRGALRATSPNSFSHNKNTSGKVSKQVAAAKRTLSATKHASQSVNSKLVNAIDSDSATSISSNNHTNSSRRSARKVGLTQPADLKPELAAAGTTTVTTENLENTPVVADVAIETDATAMVESSDAVVPAEDDVAAVPIELMSPAESVELDSDASDIAEMSDDKLQQYCSEFEAASQGHIIESDSDYSPLSPELESSDTKMFNGVGTSSFDLNAPLNSTRLASGAFDVNMTMDLTASMNMGIDLDLNTTNTPLEYASLDDFVTYTDEGENTTDADAFNYLTQKRRVPLCVYRRSGDTSPISMSFNPNKRTLMAAWETVAADSHHTSREAYIQSVLLAAASLKQRSMVTGLARQTMAPALGTSH